MRHILVGAVAPITSRCERIVRSGWKNQRYRVHDDTVETRIADMDEQRVAEDRLELKYYPKLIVAVPFTPATGSRLLVRAGVDRTEATQAFVAGLRSLCEKLGLSGASVKSAMKFLRFTLISLPKIVNIFFIFIRPLIPTASACSACCITKGSAAPAR